MLRTAKILLSASVVMALLSCHKSETAEQHQKEADSAAGKVGQAAYGAAKVTEKAAKAAGKEISKAAHDAHEGWKKAEQKDKAKQ